MSDPTWDLIIKLVTVFGPIVIGLLVAWNTSQGQRITALNAGREQDRKDRDELKDNVKFWHDESDRYLEDLKTARTDQTALNSSYVALATKHDETRSQLGTVQEAHRDLNVRFEKKVTELDQVRADLSKQTDNLSTATSTIDSLQSALLSERASHDDALTRMNNKHAEKQERLQAQIDSLTEQLKRAEADIITLRNQLSEYDSINMKLAGEIRALELERDTWQIERTELLRQIANLKALDAKMDISNAQGKLANQQLTAMRYENAQLSNPDNPDQTAADNAAHVANDKAASMPVIPQPEPPDPVPPDGSGAKQAVPTNDVIVTLPQSSGEERAA